MSHRADLMQLQMAVLFGGRTGERDVSIASSRTVLDTLRGGGYAPRPIDTAASGWWAALEGVDIAFNIQHGRGGEDGVTQGLLESIGVVGTGSGVLGSALAMDKLRSKQLWTANELPTPEFVCVDERTDVQSIMARWGEAFIKPSREGSSLGMRRVASVPEFAAAVDSASRHDRQVIAERFVDGPEYTVSILGERALPAIRIEAARDFYDYQAKYHSDSTRYHIPCGLQTDEERELAELALRAFRALGCSVWGRVDVMRDAQGDFLLLEANTVPGMTDHSLVPMAAQAAGMSMLELLEEILWLSWQAAASHGERT